MQPTPPVGEACPQGRQSQRSSAHLPALALGSFLSSSESRPPLGSWLTGPGGDRLGGACGDPGEGASGKVGVRWE